MVFEMVIGEILFNINKSEPSNINIYKIKQNEVIPTTKIVGKSNVTFDNLLI